MLEFENVSYVYGANTPFEKKALDDVSFKIEKGKVNDNIFLDAVNELFNEILLIETLPLKEKAILKDATSGLFSLKSRT